MGLATAAAGDTRTHAAAAPEPLCLRGRVLDLPHEELRHKSPAELDTLHDGFHELPDKLLFDLANDPHEQHDLTAERPDIVARAEATLADWHSNVMQNHPTGVDPMQTVLAEGGPWHIRGHLPAYLERLRATGRGEAAERLAKRYSATAD